MEKGEVGEAPNLGRFETAISDENFDQFKKCWQELLSGDRKQASSGLNLVENGEFGCEIADYLSDRYKSAGLEEKSAILTAMGNLGSRSEATEEQTFDFLLSLVNLGDEIRPEYIEALKRKGFNIITKDNDERKLNLVFDRMFEIAQDDNIREEDRIEAIDNLSQFATDDKSISKLRELVKSKQKEVADKVLSELVEVTKRGDEEVVSMLIKRLNEINFSGLEQHRQVRILQELGKMLTPGRVDVVEELSVDDEIVEIEKQRAIKSINNED